MDFYTAIFNGLELLGMGAALALAALATYAHRRHDAIDVKDDVQVWPLADDLALARAVRESYDGLPYRRSGRHQ